VIKPVGACKVGNAQGDNAYSWFHDESSVFISAIRKFMRVKIYDFRPI
jgi:hypothetical protein